MRTHLHMSSPTRALAHSWILVSKGVPFQSGSRQSLNLSSFFPSKSRVDVTSGFFQSGNLFKVVSLHHLDSWSASEREWVCVSEWVFEVRVREKESNLTIHRLTFLPSFHLFFSFFQFASKVFFCHKDDFSFSLLLSRILWKRIILKGHQLRLQTIFCFFWTKTKINLCTMVAIKPKRVKILSIEISRAFDIKSLSLVWHSEIDCCASDWNWASCELIL